MHKRCDNCKYYDSGIVKDLSGSSAIRSWCNNEKHVATYVPCFTCCPEHELKEVKTTPFDGIKFYIKDTSTGELSVKYTCEDCGKEMWDAPDRWWLVLPLNNNHKRRTGYHFRCEECDKKKEGKI